MHVIKLNVMHVYSMHVHALQLDQFFGNFKLAGKQQNVLSTLLR